MLSRFSTRNIKSIGEDGVTLELKPLTILVGPNSSGKSSILQALAIIYQSLGQKQLRYDGELIQFSSIEDLIHKNDIQKWISFEFILKESLLGLHYEFKYDTEECKQAVIKNKKEFLSVELVGTRKEGLELITKLPNGKIQTRGKESWSLGILDSNLLMER